MYNKIQQYTTSRIAPKTVVGLTVYAVLLEYIARCLTYAGTVVYALRLDHPFYSIDDLLFVPFSPITYDGTVLAVDSVRTALENGQMAFNLSTPRGLAIAREYATLEDLGRGSDRKRLKGVYGVGEETADAVLDRVRG